MPEIGAHFCQFNKIKNQPQKENQQTRQWLGNSFVLDPKYVNYLELTIMGHLVTE